MNIYKMKYKEYDEARKEFLRIPFGVGVTVFSLLPAVFAFVLLLFSIVDFAVEENEGAGVVAMVGAGCSFACFCITQLLYSMLLKDFVNSKEKK